MKEDFDNPFGLKDVKGNIRPMSNLLDMAVFPGIQGGPLEHIIAGKAIAFGEILTEEFTVYAKQVVNNAQAMAKAFVDKGYHLISSGTDNHLMLIDLRNKNISGKKAEQALVKADITLNAWCGMVVCPDTGRTVYLLRFKPTYRQIEKRDFQDIDIRRQRTKNI